MYRMFYGIMYLGIICLALGIGSGKKYYGKPIQSPWNQYIYINRGTLGIYEVYRFKHNGETYRIYPYKIKFSSDFVLNNKTSAGFKKEISTLKLTNDKETNKDIIVRHFKRKFKLQLQIF